MIDMQTYWQTDKQRSVNQRHQRLYTTDVLPPVAESVGYIRLIVA